MIPLMCETHYKDGHSHPYCCEYTESTAEILAMAISLVRFHEISGEEVGEKMQHRLDKLQEAFYVRNTIMMHIMEGKR